MILLLILLIAGGVGLNAVVMAANGGMPVSRAAVHFMGWDASSSDDVFGKHVWLTSDTRFALLADRLQVELGVGRALLSVGDIVLLAGVSLWMALGAPATVSN